MKAKTYPSPKVSSEDISTPPVFAILIFSQRGVWTIYALSVFTEALKFSPACPKEQGLFPGSLYSYSKIPSFNRSILNADSKHLSVESTLFPAMSKLKSFIWIFSPVI